MSSYFVSLVSLLIPIENLSYLPVKVSYCKCCIKAGPYLAFLWLWFFFCLEIGRLLSDVTKQTKNKYLNRLLSIPDSPEDVYPLLRLSISTPNSIWPFFSIMCVKITGKLNISFTYVSVMNN